jgi:hypothetical protein
MAESGSPERDRADGIHAYGFDQGQAGLIHRVYPTPHDAISRA